MAKITTAQMRMIYGLAKKKGMDNDTLHAYIYQLTNKSSLKHLSIMDAKKVIDSLSGIKASGESMISFKQQRYIEGLAIDLGWTNESGKLNRERLSVWLQKKYGISHINWLTSKKASDAIEGLKAMKARIREAAQEAIL